MVTVNAGVRLDRLPLSSFHRRILTLISIGMFFDGYDLYLAATVLGATLNSHFSTLAQNAQFVSVSFLGMMVGSFLTGFLGDRYGRRFTYQANLVIFGLASLASAFAPTMFVLILLRGVMGVGLGAEMVAGYSAMAEFLPPQARGRWCGILNAVVVASLPVSALASALLIPRFGWRLMFVIGGVGALIVWFLRKAMPESPRWLESVGRTEEAEALLQNIEREVALQSCTSPSCRFCARRPAAGLRRAVRTGAFPPSFCRRNNAHCGQHADLRIRYLAAHIFRPAGPEHRQFV